MLLPVRHHSRPRSRFPPPLPVAPRRQTIRKRILFSPLILMLCLACTVVHAQTGTAEFDVIFPRPNETYKRVYPFPIIFALQNPAAVWPYSFKYFWELQPVNRSISGDGDTFPDHTQGIQTSGTFEGSDPVINIFDTKAVINATTKEWFLYWHLFITYNCTPAAEGADDTSPTLAEEIPRAMGAFNLYFDDEGKLPDIYTPSSSKGEDTNCPIPLWTVNIKSQEKPRGVTIQTSADTCPFLDPDNPHPNPNPCAVRPTEEFAKNISAIMLSTARCANVAEWPSKLLTGFCGDELESWASRGISGIGLTTVFAIITILSLIA